MSALGLFFLVATFTPLLLNHFTRQKADTIGLAGMLVIVWVFERLLRVWYDPPEALRPYSVIDFTCGLITLRAWARGGREWWKMALVSVFAFQLCGHAAYWWSWVEDPTNKHALRVYMVYLNLTYLVELALVSVGGVRSVLAALGARISGRARNLSDAGRRL
jgi:hypothetical protein